jgi:small subunit ribosomal protein S20
MIAACSGQTDHAAPRAGGFIRPNPATEVAAPSGSVVAAPRQEIRIQSAFPTPRRARTDSRAGLCRSIFALDYAPANRMLDSFSPTMANTKSAIKNARKNSRRKLRNQRVNTRIKTLARRLSAAKTSGDGDAVKAAAQAYISALDKAANKGIIHRNSASRHKSVCAGLLVAK